MLKHQLLFCFSIFLLTGCKTSWQVSQITPQQNEKILPSMEEDQKAKTLIEPYKLALEKQMNEKISHTNVDLIKNGDNPNLGNLLADYTLQGAQKWGKKNSISKIDGALINIGGIRSTIGAGDILLKHVYEVMPFENELVIVKMDANAMKELFEYYLEKQKPNPVSNFKIATEKGKLTEALIDNKPIENTKTYYIATSDYLALGGDDMRFFAKGELISTGVKLRDLYIEKFRENPEIIPPTNTRLIFKK